MYPETKFKPDRRTPSAYQAQSSIYHNIDHYINSKTGTPNYDYSAMSHSNSSNSQERDYRNKSFEYHEKYSSGISDPNLKTTNYGISTKKTYPQRKTLFATPGASKTTGYTSQIAPPKTYSSNIMSSGEIQKQKASISAYNLIPKSLLSDDTKKPTQSTKETKQSVAQNNISSNKRNSLGQYPVTKAGHNKRNSGNYDNRRRSQSHPIKSKSDNLLQKPKLGVIGVLSAKKSLNEFSKRSSRILSQQTEEINNLKARIQELTSDQEILRKLNEVSTEDTLLEFNDKYLTPLLNKMSTYLMKFSSEYNEMIKSNSDFVDSQHNRTECLVELAANLNSQLHNFIESFECDRFDERTYNEKRGQIDVIADTTSRLNSQLARVVLQLDDYRDSPDFQKDNMTNSIQSLSDILQQLNRATITVNQKISEYENTIQQKDAMLEDFQNTKRMEIESLKDQIRQLAISLEEKPIVRELENQNKELMNGSENANLPEVSNETLEKYKHDLVALNHNLATVTLLFDSQIKEKSGLMKDQEQKINDLTERSARLNSQIANLTLLFDSEINLKDKIIKDKEAQIEKLRKTAAELNHNLSVISLLTNDKDIANKRHVNDLMETISNLQTKWAAINGNLLTLTSTVNDQLRSKNEEIRLNRQDVVYFRNFTRKLYKQMMDYVGDFLQRIWDKNHENELLLEKNKELIDYCTDLNSRVAKFTLEINDLQKENDMLIKKLANGEFITSEPVATREVVREVVREIPVIREVQVPVPGLQDDAKIEYYKNMAVDLNNRVAMLSLDIDSLKLNKFNNEPIIIERSVPVSNDNYEEIIYTEVYEDESKIDFYRNQAVSLNSNLAKLTLEHNDFKNRELLEKNDLIKNSQEKIEYYQQMAANLNTRLAMLSLEMNDLNKPNDTINATNDEKSEYYQNLILTLNSKISDLLVENENLKVEQRERSIPAVNVNTVNTVNNQEALDRFRDLAVDLNTRLAKLTLELNEKPKNVESNNFNDNYIKKIQDQVVDLNQRLSVLTLDANDEIKNLKKQLAEKDQGSFKNKVIELNQRLAVLTLNDNDEINALRRELAQKEQGSLRNQVVNLNQRLSVLTLNSNDEINGLKKQLAQKEQEIDRYRNRLASMNRQIIDLTYSSNLERQNSIPTNIEMVKDRSISNNNNYETIINEKDLIIRKLQAQLAEMNTQNNNNNSSLMTELDNERRKNQELNQSIIAMRNEMQSITDYLKETVSCASTIQPVTNNNNINNNSAIIEEIASIAKYLNETKRSLEDYQNCYNQEINSISGYLKDTIKMAEDYQNYHAQEMSSLSEYLKDTIQMAEEYKLLNIANTSCDSEGGLTETFEKYDSDERRYDSEETVENQQIGIN